VSRAEDLLAVLAARGISVVADGRRLRFKPRSALSPAVIARIRECRSELLGALGVWPDPPPPRAPAVPAPLQLGGRGLTLTERWLLSLLAARPGLPRLQLQLEVDLALGTLLERAEIRGGADGSLVLNVR
jgi:hypothetical protein